MTVVVFEEDVLRLICGYAPQSGRSLEEKQYFYNELICEWDMHSADDLVMCLGDISGHVGRHINDCDGGQWILKERILLEFCLEMELGVSITLFKREEKRKVTFIMGEMRQKLTLC